VTLPPLGRAYSCNQPTEATFHPMHRGSALSLRANTRGVAGWLLTSQKSESAHGVIADNKRLAPAPDAQRNDSALLLSVRTDAVEES
jgi:hypothetical protein